MKTFTNFISVFISAVFLFSCSQSTSPDTDGMIQMSVAPGDTNTIELNVGESVKLDDHTTIKFNGVTGDSRCPEGVECIWAGNGEIELLIDGNQTVSLNTYLRPQEVHYKDYKIRLVELSPYPKAGEEIDPDTYKVQLEITTSENNVILISYEDKDLIDTDPLDIRNLRIENDSLYADVSYSGGCKVHDIRLYGFREIMESYPPRMRVQFSHNGMDDPCEAYPTEYNAYNIFPIKELVSGEGYDEIILVIYAPHSEDKLREISYKF